jgi:hypothetical protein
MAGKSLAVGVQCTAVQGDLEGAVFVQGVQQNVAVRSDRQTVPTIAKAPGVCPDAVYTHYTGEVLNGPGDE